MADEDLSSAPPPAAHPMANPGYGKRSAPEQPPRTPGDFAHLTERERSVAALIDRLPEGAAMSGKALATSHPRYGQAACLSALRGLSAAGHLRRTREHVVLPEGSRWVTRTYFSRNAHDDTWWTDVLAGREPQQDGDAPCVEKATTSPSPRTEPGTPGPQNRGRSPAYAALASLGRADTRLTLSAADCAALEPLAAQWLERDPAPQRFVSTLAAGLPPEVHSAHAFTRTRLRDKMPPEPAPPPPLRIMECTVCGTPDRPENLPGGLCAPCRRTGPEDGARRLLTPDETHSRAAEARRAVRDAAVDTRREAGRRASRRSTAGVNRP